MLKIQKFDIANIKQHKIVLCIGKRGTGKSTLLREIMNAFSPNVDFGLAMSPTHDSCDCFMQHMPKSWVYDSFDVQRIDTMLKMQRERLKCGKSPRNLFLILDDCLYDKKNLKGVTIRDVFLNGRHAKLSVALASQYCMDMSPDLRSQIDYIFVLRETIYANRVKLWRYLFGAFETYNDFSKTLDACTENFGALVLDNTSRSNEIEKMVYWFKARHGDEMPPFRMGSEVFWRLSQKAEVPSGSAAARANSSKEKEGKKVSTVVRFEGERPVVD